jgi:hypothetical protein
MNSNNKLITIVNNIRNLYIDDLYRYVYIGPDDRSTLKKGSNIKYVDIMDKKRQLKSGVIVDITIDKITLKSIGTNFYWKIKVNSNHIFYLERNGMKLLLNDFIGK